MKRIFALLALSVVGAALMASDANAQAFTFASFNYNKSSGGALGFANNNVLPGQVDVTASGSADGGAPITFTFEDTPFLANGLLADGSISARLQWGGTQANLDATAGPFVTQNFAGSTTLISIFATETKNFGSVTVNAGDFLLSVAFNGGLLSGLSIPGQDAPAFFGAGEANSLVFSGGTGLFDFSDMDGGRNFGTTYTSISTGNLQVNTPTNDLIRSFTAGGAQGSFGAILVPEPASLAMVGLGLIGMPALVVIRRRRAAR
jgi:hypothetical protein